MFNVWNSLVFPQQVEIMMDNKQDRKAQKLKQHKYYMTFQPPPYFDEAVIIDALFNSKFLWF